MTIGFPMDGKYSHRPPFAYLAALSLKCLNLPFQPDVIVKT